MSERPFKIINADGRAILVSTISKAEHERNNALNGLRARDATKSLRIPMEASCVYDVGYSLELQD